MIMGVISDSHDNLQALRETLQRLLEERVDLVVHLGDIISPFTVKFMKNILRDIKVVAIRGNNDGDVFQVSSLFSQYGWVFKPEPSIIEVAGRRVLLVHGYGGVEDTLTLINALAKSLDVDLVLYGHTHKATVDRVEGKIVLNPGEVCGYLTGRVSYAVVDLETLRAEIEFLGGGEYWSE